MENDKIKWQDYKDEIKMMDLMNHLDWKLYKSHTEKMIHKTEKFIVYDFVFTTDGFYYLIFLREYKSKSEYTDYKVISFDGGSFSVFRYKKDDSLYLTGIDLFNKAISNIEHLKNLQI